MSGDIPDPPAAVCGTTVLMRLVDGLAFRYRWATEGLTDADIEFRPVADAMSLRELLDHLHRLASWVEGTVQRTLDGDAPSTLAREPLEGDADSTRTSTLEHLARLRGHLSTMSDEQLAEVTTPATSTRGPHPFWNLINGPLADALTHVGQVNTYRRINGNPAPAVDVFRGVGARGE